MTMTRILQCVLVLFVLTTAGCSLFETESETPKTSNSPTANDNRKKIDFGDSESKVRDALRKMKPSAGSPGFTVKQVQADVTAALEKLKLDPERVNACSCAEAIGEAKAAHSLLTTVTNTIGPSSQKISELEVKVRDDI